ncbi:hypothetical protein B0T18DRAFT_417977 [Schizothecium vesticola]|uniref:Uncharacterized protein n=1 Tax=Schizothecium vesticola TaxID=314040 RepID=A0AA40EJE9_9PEZI|nr:hypothetical protein B0T18DRAFT_417977 [Schizothecium vesticola]
MSAPGEQSARLRAALLTPYPSARSSSSPVSLRLQMSCPTNREPCPHQHRCICRPQQLRQENSLSGPVRLRAISTENGASPTKSSKAMASLCNYTHPELQNTSGLERQGHGVLFPYNPEFYDRASGLYGPGTIIAWNMLFVSLLINAFFPEFPDTMPGRHNFWSGMSGELVTFVAYPMFAATDLLVHGIQLTTHQHRALVLRCLRNPSGNSLQGVRDVEYPQQPLDLADIPPDILSLGQRIVEVTGPLDVSYSSFPLLASWIMVTSGTLSPKCSAASLFLRAGTTYIVLLVFIFHCTLGSFSTGVLDIPLVEIVRLLWKAVGVVVIMADLIVAGGMILGLFRWCLTPRLRVRGDLERIAPTPQDGKPEDNLCYAAPGAALIGLALWAMNTQWLGALRPNSPWVPDLGVSVSEQDQLAALIAASMSLCCTLYCAVRRIHTDPRTEEVGDTVELHDSLLPERDSHDVEALVGARRISTM